jgi:glutamyl-tRNA reductase
VNIEVVGVNFRSAPVEIREQLYFNPEEQRDFLEYLRQCLPEHEWVILSTCNRTELYRHSDTSEGYGRTAEDEICRQKRLNAGEFRKYFYCYRGIGAVRHLFRVASGLDSLVCGEDQILGQVKQAHQRALELGTSKAVLNTLFRRAVTGAKILKSRTGPSRIPVSVASSAVATALKLSGEAGECRTALVIGSGVIGVSTVNSLIARRIGRIYLASRRLGKIHPAVARYPQVESVAYERRYEYMDRADLVFSMTSSPHYTVTREKLEATLKTGKVRIFVDLAVPRDIDEAIATLPGVNYFNIDGLGRDGRDDWHRQAVEAVMAESILDEQSLGFERWYQSRRVLPIIREVERTLREEIAEQINHTLGKLKTVDPRDREKIAQGMQKIAGYLLNRCLYRIKENVSGADAGIYYQCLGKSMHLEEFGENQRGRNRTRR